MTTRPAARATVNVATQCRAIRSRIATSTDCLAEIRASETALTSGRHQLIDEARTRASPGGHILDDADVAEPALLENPPRCSVLGIGGGEESVITERVAREVNEQPGRLGRVAATPVA